MYEINEPLEIARIQVDGVSGDSLPKEELSECIKISYTSQINRRYIVNKIVEVIGFLSDNLSGMSV